MYRVIGLVVDWFDFIDCLVGCSVWSTPYSRHDEHYFVNFSILTLKTLQKKLLEAF